MMEHVGISIIEIGDDHLKGKMPVDHRTIQTFGLLHGGASVTLAESLGSIASNLVIDPSKNYCVGLEVNANHLRSAKKGLVFGTVKPVHLGKKTHVWSIQINDEDGHIIGISRITNIVK